MKRLWCLIALVVALVALVPVRATAGLRADDARLDRPISLSEERIYLGELLERIQGQAGIAMEADDSREAVSGIPLTVHLEARPAREVLHGLQELLSHRFLAWSWAAGANDAYVLRPSEAPTAATARARKAADERFHADLRELYALAQGDEAARVKRAKERPALFPGRVVDADRMALWRALRAEEVAALTSGKAVTVSASRLSDEGKRALRLGITPSETPAQGILQIRRLGADPAAKGLRRAWLRTLGPVLYLQCGEMAVNFFGGALWDTEWLSTVAPGWRYQDDPEVKAWRDREAEGPPRGSPLPEATAPAHTLTIARQRHLSLLVDFTGAQEQSYNGIRLAEGPQDAISSLIARFQLTAKAHGGLHLFRVVNGITYRDYEPYSWPNVVALRRALRRNDGFPDLPLLLRISELTDAQLADLVPDFGPTNISVPLLGKGGVWRALLNFVRQLPVTDQARTLLGEPLVYQDAPQAAREALAAATDARFLTVLGRLNGNAGEATVRFSVGPRKPTRLEKAERELVCEVTFPDRRPYRCTYPLQAYRATADRP